MTIINALEMYANALKINKRLDIKRYLINFKIKSSPTKKHILVKQHIKLMSIKYFHAQFGTVLFFPKHGSTIISANLQSQLTTIQRNKLNTF